MVALHIFVVFFCYWKFFFIFSFSTFIYFPKQSDIMHATHYGGYHPIYIFRFDR